MIESFRSAAAEIVSHKLRSLLTLTGIVLGCLALVVMSSVMDGVAGSVRQGFEDLGFDGVIAVFRRDPRTPQESVTFQRSPGLRFSDAVALRRRAVSLAEVSGRIGNQLVVSANGTDRRVQVIGIEPSYARIRNREPAEGRFFSEGDLARGSRVCILGRTLRRELFGVEECLGREVTIGGKRFTVVGVGRRLGNSWFREGDLSEEMLGVMVPLTTFLREFTGTLRINMIEMKLRDPDDYEAGRSEAERILLTEHQGVNDFHVENVAAEMLQGRAQAEGQIRSWRIVMLSVAAVTLLVGGVGLLSVLLISLAERTYEVGLRKALGATGPDIFGLFLAESLLLAVAGAGIGIACGIGVTRLAARGFRDGLPLSPGGIWVALAAALLVGAFFGIGPALRASRMPPVDALREGG